MKLTTFIAPYEHVLFTCAVKVFRFSWIRINFNREMQIQAQIGDTGRVLYEFAKGS